MMVVENAGKQLVCNTGVHIEGKWKLLFKVCNAGDAIFHLITEDECGE